VTSTVTTTTSAPSWYDVLDLGLGASETEVRDAWKAAIADLEPSDRRFRLLNQAAEVLLDRDSRAAYDAELMTAELDTRPLVEEGARPLRPLVEEGALAPVTKPASETDRPTGWVAPGWLLVTVAAVAALVVGACAAVASTAPSDASIAGATREAQSSAERAVVPILSYDAAHLDEDQQAAEGLMTAEYRAEYAELFEVVKDNAPGLGTKVTAEVVASGVVRSGEDRVAVLVFVNRPTTNKQLEQPVVYKDQVTVTMQKVGDQWLVDDLVTSPAS
jgi:Mce-associated membrane protein